MSPSPTARERLLTRGEMVHPDPEHPGIGVRMISGVVVREALDAIEAAAVAEERARLRAVVEALDAVECLPIADFPENSIDYGEGVCDERHRVVAAVLALLDEQS